MSGGPTDSPPGHAVVPPGNAAPPNGSGRRDGRRAAIVEAIVVGGGALFAIFVLIPQQTTPSPDAAGLAPATLPTLCAAIIAILSVFRLLASLAASRKVPVGHVPAGQDAAAAGPGLAGSDLTGPVRVGPFPVALLIVAVAIAGLFGLMLFGPVACAAIIVLTGMPVLGERRWLPIALCTAGAMAAAWPLQ